MSTELEIARALDEADEAPHRRTFDPAPMLASELRRLRSQLAAYARACDAADRLAATLTRDNLAPAQLVALNAYFDAR